MPIPVVFGAASLHVAQNEVNDFTSPAELLVLSTLCGHLIKVQNNCFTAFKYHLYFWLAYIINACMC